MITINVLPPQYRTDERTPLPVYLAFIGGIVLLVSLGIIYAHIMQRRRALASERDNIATRVKAKEEAAREIDQIEMELVEAQRRVADVVTLAQQKIFWSQKLNQLHNLIPAMIWIEKIVFGEPQETGYPVDGPALVLSCAARGNDPERVKKFLTQLEEDTNFIYHFEQPLVQEIHVEDANERYDGDFLVREVSVFDVVLRIRPSEFREAEMAGPTGQPGG